MRVDYSKEKGLRKGGSWVILKTEGRGDFFLYIYIKAE